MSAIPSHLRVTCCPARVSGRTLSLSQTHTRVNLPNTPLLDFSSSFLQMGAWAIPEPPPSAGGAHSPQVKWQSSESDRSSSGRPARRYFENKLWGTSLCVCVHVYVCAFVNHSAQVDQKEDGTEEETPHLLNCLCLTVSLAESNNPKQLVFQVCPSGPQGVPWRWSETARCLFGRHGNHPHQQRVDFWAFCQKRWK